MSDGYPVPTWGDIDRFCSADGWTNEPTTDHVRWEKRLPSGELLRTKRSLAANDEIGPDLFRLILRTQLKVSREEFWQAIQTGQPVDRPTDLDEAPTFKPWVMQQLLARGYTEDQIRELGPDGAEARVYEFWSEQQ